MSPDHLVSGATSMAVAARCRWDAVVVGAGPAGSTVARELARRGRSVLLIDKQPFPRAKVCGCCLSAAADRLLQTVGLGEIPRRCGGVPLRNALLASGNARAHVDLPGGFALSRETLDLSLVQAAVRSGASLLTGACALDSMNTGNDRHVMVDRHNERAVLQARIVIAADGLASRFLRNERSMAVRVCPNAHIGGAAFVRQDADSFSAGTIYMLCGSFGYLGVVRVEDDRLNLAAAFDPRAVRERGGFGLAASELLRTTGMPSLPAVRSARWRGTPALTRRRAAAAADRLFVIGDSVAYVEPFTGEGMYWAIATALALAPIADNAIEHWSPRLCATWTQKRDQLLGGRLFRCRCATGLLRSAWMTRALIAAIGRFPSLARPYVRSLNKI